jgi:DNA polymerase-3 subunit alpha
VFIKASLKFEGDSPRFTANFAEALNKVTAKARKGLQVMISSKVPLDAIKEALKDANSGRGQGEVWVIVFLDTGERVDVKLKGGFAITPEVMREIRSISGIKDIEEL